MTADLAMMPAYQLVKLFKARKASPVEAAKAALARIEAFTARRGTRTRINALRGRW